MLDIVIVMNLLILMDRVGIGHLHYIRKIILPMQHIVYTLIHIIVAMLAQLEEPMD